MSRTRFALPPTIATAYQPIRAARDVRSEFLALTALPQPESRVRSSFGHKTGSAVPRQRLAVGLALPLGPTRLVTPGGMVRLTLLTPSGKTGRLLLESDLAGVNSEERLR